MSFQGTVLLWSTNCIKLVELYQFEVWLDSILPVSTARLNEMGPSLFTQVHEVHLPLFIGLYTLVLVLLVLDIYWKGNHQPYVHSCFW